MKADVTIGRPSNKTEGKIYQQAVTAVDLHKRSRHLLTEKLWTGMGRFMVPIPAFIWKRQVRGNARAIAGRLDFMSEQHHLVREFAVREMPRVGGPISPELIAEDLGLPRQQVAGILDDLEKNLTSLCRNEAGAVEWAYPVTAHETPHQITFRSGERLYAA